MFLTDRQTGYPSLDKPWLKYYEKALNEDDIPQCSAFHLLYESNKEFLNDTALLFFNREISYGQLINQIKKAAKAFNALGIKKGDIVTLQVLNMPQTITIFYALSYIGAVANIVYVTTSEKELSEILINTDSKMYITIDALWPKMQEGIKNTKVENVLLLKVGEEADVMTRVVLSLKGTKTSKNVLIWKKFLTLGTADVNEINDSSIPVAMVYTSGTTGKSKAVVLTNKSMNALVCQYANAGIGLTRGGKFMNSLPEFIAFGLVFALHVPLCLGLVDIIILDPKPTSVGKYFAKYKPNFYVNGKIGIEAVINNPKVKKMNLDFIKVLAAGGESIPLAFEKTVKEFLRDRGNDNVLSVGYGMTEVAATVVTSTPRVNRPGTVGIPLPGTVIKIVEPGTTKELTYDTDGEICFHTPTMMKGYYKQNIETEKVIKKHEDGLLWVHSGDIGRISEDGFLTIVGRIKRIIAVRENGIYHKVFPKMIEEILDKYDEVEAVVVVGRPKPIIENELVAFVIQKAGVNNLNIDKLKNYSKEMLESWEIPVEFITIDEIPRSTVGKIDYKSLEKIAINTEKKMIS